MAAAKRRYVAFVIALLLIVGIPGYLTMYTSPDPDYSEPQPASEETDETDTEREVADAPPAPVFPDLGPSTAPGTPASPPVAAVATADVPSYEEPELDPGASGYVSSCRTEAAVLPNPNADDRRRNLKIATAAPEGSYFVQRLREAAKLVETQTAGRIRLKFYGGGVMGSDEQVLKKLQIRNLHGAVIAPASLQEAVPALGIYRVPMLFRSAAEVAHLREIMDPVLYSYIRDAGYVSFCLVGNGFSNLFSRQPIRGEYDLRDRRVWAPEGDLVAYAAWRALDISPSPLPFTDLFVGLQTSLLDIVPISPVGVLSLRMYTQLDYVTDLPWAYDYSLLVMDARVFGQLSTADQQVVAAALNAALYDLDSSSFPNSLEAIGALVQHWNIEPVPADPGFRSQLEGLMREETMDMIVNGILPKDLTLQALQILEDYRAAAP